MTNKTHGNPGARRKTICLGETVLDIIFRDGRPLSANPGGSSFNSAISLGRAGADISFIGETGTPESDQAGKQVREFLAANGVDSSFMREYPDMKTTVSLAFLDENNDAHYTFYSSQPAKREPFLIPHTEKDDILVFGSFYSVNPAMRPQVKPFLDEMDRRETLIYYDMNFRPSHSASRSAALPNVYRNMELADVVRGSVDDLGVLFGCTDPGKVYREEISSRCRNFICTDGASPVRIFDGDRVMEYPVEQVEAVSTIGAGDSFNAGFAFGLVGEGITKKMLREGLPVESWNALASYACRFSSECCRNVGNYISVEFGKRL